MVRDQFLVLQIQNLGLLSSFIPDNKDTLTRHQISVKCKRMFDVNFSESFIKNLNLFFTNLYEHSTEVFTLSFVKLKKFYSKKQNLNFNTQLFRLV